MATQKTNPGLAFTLAGMGIGLLATTAVRLVAGYFFKLPFDMASFISWGIAGLIIGGYFGYVLSHFNYDALFKHTEKNRKK